MIIFMGINFFIQVLIKNNNSNTLLIDNNERKKT